MPVNGSDVKVVYYTRSAYNNLSTKDDNTIYYVQETNGKLSLYIGNRAMGYANDNDVVKLSGNQTVAGRKTFSDITYFQEEISVDSNAKFNDDTDFNGSAYFYSDAIFNGLAEFNSNVAINNDVEIDSGANIRQNKTPTNSYDLVNKGYVDKNDRVKLLRARSGTTALTVHNNTSVTGVGSQLTLGDTIMFEVQNTSAITSSSPKILTATVSSTTNSASAGRSVTFTTWTGSEMKVYSLSVALSTTGVLNFGNMNVMTMSKSGTDMNIYNSAYTAYIGRIWKVDGSVI